MKLGAITIVVLCLVSAQLPKSGSEPQSKADQKQQNATSPPKQTVAVNNQPSPAPDKRENKNDEIDVERKLAKFTFYLVIVGAIQCLILFGQGVLFLQQRRIMEQHRESLDDLAGAAEDNAEAALLGAKAVINSERPWITFLLPEKPIVPEQINDTPDGATVVGFVKNVGRTPAIIEKKFHFGSTVRVTENLPTVPPYLQIDESQTEYQIIPEATEPATARIKESDMYLIRQGTLNLYLLGQILYKDATGQPHETRYCFRYFPRATTGRLPGFYPDGPSEYLKTT